ncbi:MAG TPA: putative transporter [Chthoniobacterales bacterium]
MKLSQTFVELQTSQPVAYTVIVLAAVAALGLALGSIKIRGTGLGIAGVLFAGIVFGHFQFHIDPVILGFVREFGLIVFVYTIGMQVGPGFFASLRRGGIQLNLMAACVVLLGATVMLLVTWFAKMDIAAAAGLLAGATTNTPSLAAAQETLKTIPELTQERLGLPTIGYAVAYPFGVIGIILAMLIIRACFRINVRAEIDVFQRDRSNGETRLERMSIVVENENLDGLVIHELPGIHELGVVVSRVKHADSSEVFVAQANTVVRCGDVVLAVGCPQHLDQFRLILGEVAPFDLSEMPGPITSRTIVVTHKEVLGKSLQQLGIQQRFDVTVTRVTRSGIELPAEPKLSMEFGDTVVAVGREADVSKVAEVLGNSAKELNHTNFIPIFVGIGLGVLIGLFPLQLGQMPAPIRFGLAGGPLIVAIVLSRVGRIGPLVWYMPANANAALREFGIVLFLAAVGLKAGDHFVEVLLRGSGFSWMGYGALITLLPLLIVGSVARLVFKENFMNICGVLAGSMTDPPALAFANSIGDCEGPSIAYATVYPLTMLLRIFIVQLLLLFFCR